MEEKKQPPAFLMTALRKAAKIPADLRSELHKKIEATRNDIRFKDADMTYFFDIYNTHLNRSEPERINCGSCQAKVVGNLRVISGLWEEVGLNAGDDEQ